MSKLLNTCVNPRNLRVGDQSGSYTLESISEYKVDTKGYITTWSTPRGLEVIFLKSWNIVGLTYFARV